MSVFSQSNGALIGSYATMPAGSLGGTIWTTPAASGSSTWLSTGNAALTPGAINGDSYSIVRLQGATKTDIWTVPGLPGSGNDLDFGGSPTLFTGLVGTTATSMIGACNKNGVYYALQSQSLSTGPVWTYQLAGAHQLCLGAAVWDAGAHELIAGSDQTPNNHPGSIQALSPDAGAPNRVIWQSYLPCAVEGPPSEDGAGVLAVVTLGSCSPGSTNSLYLYNAHATVPNGSGPPAPQLLKTIQLGRGAFSQPAFADGYLFVASESNLMAYTSPLEPPPPPSGPPSVTPPVKRPSHSRTVSRAEIKAELVKQLAPARKAAKIAALLKRRGYTYSFRTLTAGTLKIGWYWTPRGHRGKAKAKPKPVLVAIGKATFSKAGRVKLRVKLTRTGMRMLKAARSVRLTAKGIYRPSGKPAVTATKRFVLRR
jgi:hypothetical protein